MASKNGSAFEEITQDCDIKRKDKERTRPMKKEVKRVDIHVRVVVVVVIMVDMIEIHEGGAKRAETKRNQKAADGGNC